MPDSKGRKAKKKPAPKAPRKRVVPEAGSFAQPPPEEPKRTRNPAKEIPEADRYVMPELPEPASYTQVLVALSDLDPLSQEVMIAQRLAAFPHPGDPEGRMPVPIDRRARGPWAHHLRKVGIFCIPELATHEVVTPDKVTGIMQHHSAMSSRKIEENDIWKVAKEADPSLAELVDNAKTPEEKEAAMRTLEAKLPVAQRIALQRLRQTTPEQLEPK